MVKGKVSLMEFESNPNIGLYMFVNDKFCLLGVNVDSAKKKEIENILNVPVHIVTVLGTELVGVFVAGNNDFLLLPDMSENELEKIRKIGEDAKMKVIVLNDKLNTIGNNICVGDKIILVNNDYTASLINVLKEETGYEIVKFKNPEFKAAGALIIHSNGKYFVSQEVNESEVKPILDKIASVGTVNKGGCFVASGVVGNSNGLILGSACSTVEIQNIVEAFDFV